VKIIRYLKKPVRVSANRRKDERRLLWLFVIIILLLGLLLAYFIPRVVPTAHHIYNEGVNKFSKHFKNVLLEKGFQEIETDFESPDQVVLVFKFPDARDDEIVKKAVASQLRRQGLSIDKVVNLTGGGFLYYVSYFSQPIGSVSFVKGESINEVERILLKIEEKPRLAIIIDDFGYSNNEVAMGFLQLNVKITVSIIPGHNYSRWTSSIAKKNGKEVIVHMPMEPEDRNSAGGEEEYMLSNSLSSIEIEQRILAAFTEIPEAVGMSNHMGSLATSDKELMNKVMRSLRKKGVYFVDSLTSPRSVAYEVAKKSGIPTAVRSVFLDNDREKSEIQKQFEKAIEIAKKKGEAIAIGHTNPKTLEVLRDLIEQNRFSEVSLSFASEVIL
jgi:polysaccharide deacetylase 2 family uncharacterized protein YibQ